MSEYTWQVYGKHIFVLHDRTIEREYHQLNNAQDEGGNYLNLTWAQIISNPDYQFSIAADGRLFAKRK